MMTNPNEIQTLLNHTAEEFTQACPEVSEWADWILYLCKVLEEKAMELDPEHPVGIETAFGDIADELIRRVAESGW